MDIGYVEMHGTGTQAGDIAEMCSVTDVFAPEIPCRRDDNPLFVGALKVRKFPLSVLSHQFSVNGRFQGNIGHSEAVRTSFLQNSTEKSNKEASPPECRL